MLAFPADKTRGCSLQSLAALAWLIIATPGNTAEEKQLFWGDTHVHTAYSLDASYMGNTLSPDDAYRFARGESVEVSPGRHASLRRPLDFLVVADHAEYLGIVRELRLGNPALLAQAQGRRWHRLLTEGGEPLLRAFRSEGGPRLDLSEFDYDPWEELVAYAERHNVPGSFTALIGFEWTSTPDGNNLHRNVLFRDGRERALQVRPFTFQASPDPEDLWDYMAAYEERTGGQVLAIPHNSNLSGGLMFPLQRADGSALDTEWLEKRQRWEPVVEVTQMKGDSETHPFLSPNDEFADFGRWDLANITSLIAHQDWMFPREYARAALKTGLHLEATRRINPYRFGLIGSTDSHTALATADDDNFWGKFSNEHPSPERLHGRFIGSTEQRPVYAWEMLASGYTAVWAEENTRESIFDALKRREVYATTGPRIAVRFFASWQAAEAQTASTSRLPAAAIPMGGTLPRAPGPWARPTFMATAWKDPNGASLDRLQIIKGWLDADGQLQERVYDIAWAGNRQLAENGRLPALQAPEGLDPASWPDAGGVSQLQARWSDPDYRQNELAFYYLRVLEVHSPTWQLYDHLRQGARLPEGAPRTQQERAYTSPIWVNNQDASATNPGADD